MRGPKTDELKRQIGQVRDIEIVLFTLLILAAGDFINKTETRHHEANRHTRDFFFVYFVCEFHFVKD